ncbi:Glucose/ribitol dehydrogenase [Penicillium robsamsonii]|uniref:Glucose/ribitol dehydrogenase n=1 Tax=Penicillium robsamsonii TaxID=1792511 RepID=UPI002548D4CD|nr:Glucose/ribitol dehydrogenase [Penicillium robsamsonii]KAJ5823089.1 Glucose/ribitol dehydrogenase [Penicillium robsamsonii]
MVLATGLKGAHVLITGDTRGMGEAMVHKFLQEEANVSYCARTVTNTEFAGFYSTLPEGNTARTVGTAFDVASKDAIVQWVESSAERLGRIDVIIANEHWESSFAIDVMGFVEVVRAATSYLEKSSEASIIVQSSFMGREFYRSPSKRPTGPARQRSCSMIRVNAISPGPILCKGGPWDLYSKSNPEWVGEQRPKRGPTEVAAVAVFLMRPLASFVSGANMLADGGIHVGTQ